MAKRVHPLTPFGEYVQSAQNQRMPRMTDEELSKETRISRQQLNLIKRGDSGVTVDNVESLISALRLNRDEAIRLAFNKVPVSVGLVAMAEQIAEAIQPIPASEYPKILGMIKGYAQAFN